MIFTLSTKLTFIGSTLILFRQSEAPRKFILKIFKEYFIVCPMELQGITNMLICPVLNLYFSGGSISITMIMSSLSVTRLMERHGGIRLSSFVLSGL